MEREYGPRRGNTALTVFPTEANSEWIGKPGPRSVGDERDQGHAVAKCCLFSLLAVVVAAAAVYCAHLTIEAIGEHLHVRQTYQPCQGTLIVCSTRKHAVRLRRNVLHCYEPEVSYRYTVNGKDYSATRFATGEMTWWDRQEAWNAVAELNAGGRLTVYYDPNGPASAVLVPGEQWPWFLTRDVVLVQVLVLAVLHLVNIVVSSLLRLAAMNHIRAHRPGAVFPGIGRLQQSDEGLAMYRLRWRCVTWALRWAFVGGLIGLVLEMVMKGSEGMGALQAIAMSLPILLGSLGGLFAWRSGRKPVFVVAHLRRPRPRPGC